MEENDDFWTHVFSILDTLCFTVYRLQSRKERDGERENVAKRTKRNKYYQEHSEKLIQSKIRQLEMKRSFKIRICRVISSFQWRWQWQWQWQWCRSKDTNAIPFNPTPSSSIFLQARTLKTKQAISNLRKFSTPVPPHKAEQSSLRQNLTTALSSVLCDIRPRHAISEESSCHGFRWQKEDEWYVLMASKVSNHRRKVYSSSVTADSSDTDGDDVLEHRKKKKKKRQAKNKKTTTRTRVKTSSADSCGFFSSQTTEESFSDDFPEETETLVPSTQISPSGNDQKSKRMKQRKSKKKVSKERGSVSSEMSPESPARLSVFQRFIPCKVEGKVRESLAVVKRSEDPYEDFRRSMMEMILENNMFEDNDLKQLLQCFLSLNSSQHHGIIIQAFSEIWNSLFSSRR